MAELILNQFTRNSDLDDLVGKQISSVFTQSVYSASNLTPGDSRVHKVLQMGSGVVAIIFDNGWEYLVENGKVIYNDG